MRSSVRSTALLYPLTLAIALAALPSYAQQSPATKRLLERNKMFEDQIIKVADNVYTAIGYQVTANSMIIGDDGVIIIDRGQAAVFASRVRKAFEEITDKPVKQSSIPILTSRQWGSILEEGKDTKFACSNSAPSTPAPRQVCKAYALERPRLRRSRAKSALASPFHPPVPQPAT